MFADGHYAYAKACGIIGKSFVGKRKKALSPVKTLAEFDRLVFGEFQRETGGGEYKPLLLDLERRIEKRAVRQILSIVNCFQKPPEVIVRQLRAYEYTDLKTCLHHIEKGDNKILYFYDIGRFKTVQFKAFPNLKAMLSGTEFEFLYLDEMQNKKMDVRHIENLLDTHYYLELKKSLRELSGEDRALIERILNDEISLNNCIWALRLRNYYNKTSEETIKYLTHYDEARVLLDLPLNNRSLLSGWKWEKFLNPEHPGEHWKLDPRYFQNAASGYLHRLALSGFHRIPAAVSSVFCFIKIKQFEEDLLTSIAEGLNFGLSSAEIFKFLEAAPSSESI
ncbi:MAG: V-type ATPase subunit [Treponema sp.]|jgi:vacuolar-type H+-ATPase subunit C/Vma6|nr:V-type ATPase subunit [Treponema sp.]